MSMLSTLVRCAYKNQIRFHRWGLGLLVAVTALPAGATELTFTIDPVESFLAVDTVLVGVAPIDIPLVPQVSGNSDGDVAQYSGQIVVDVDDPLAPTRIRFISATAAASNSGLWLPDLNGGDVGDPDFTSDSNPGDPVEGNYGLYLDLNDLGAGEAYGAFRDMMFTILSEGDATIGANGTFPADVQQFVLTQGTWTTNISSDLLGDDANVDDITDDNSFNEAGSGKYTVTGQTAKLEIPISLFFPASPTFLFEGTFIATASLGGGLTGDFDGNGELDAADIDLLSAAMNSGENAIEYDLNGDNLVDQSDRTVWINDLRNTYVGDTNLDGVFDSGDFVAAFQAGQYEDQAPGNSTWSTGDWNGDTEFDSGDFVSAFQAGGYDLGPRAAVAAVPEPTTSVLLAMGLAMLLGQRRR